MRKFTKEQKINITQPKSGWKNIHKRIITRYEKFGFDLDCKKNAAGEKEYFRWNSHTQEYDIPAQKWQGYKYVTYYNYAQVAVKNNIIMFHVSTRNADFNKFAKKHDCNLGRTQETWYWNTSTDTVKYIKKETKNNWRKGKKHPKTMIKFGNLNIIQALWHLSHGFSNYLNYNKWEEILTLAGIKTRDCFSFDKYLKVNENLVKELAQRWNKNSNIKVPDDILFDLMKTTLRFVIRCESDIHSYSPINSLQKIKDPEEYIRNITKSYGKRIRKELCEKPYKAQFFNWVRKYEDNIDKLQKIIEDDHNWLMFYQNKTNILRLFKTTPFPKECVNWLFVQDSTDIIISRIRRASDISTMVNLIDEFNNTNDKNIRFTYKTYINDIRKTEDEIIKVYHQIQNLPVKFMEYDIQYKNNTEWVMKTPDNSGELSEWGRQFHNCVGSYKDKILENRCNIITMWDKTDKPMICIEVDPNKKAIVQAFAPCNIYPDSIERQSLAKWAKYNNLQMTI